MSWFMLALSKWLDYRGRSRRREYWWFQTVVGALVFVTTMVDLLMGWMTMEKTLGPLTLTVLLLAAVPGLPLQVRRLHDVGRTGWWSVMAPTGIGSLVLLVIALFDSNPQDNQYGPGPKYAPDGGKHDERAPAQQRTGTNFVKGLIFVLVVLAVLGVTVRHQIVNFLDGDRAHLQQRVHAGEIAGRNANELDCFKAAMQRTLSLPNKSIQAVTFEVLEMSACLHASAYEPTFCEDVPQQENIVASAAFINNTCAAMGLGGEQYCVSLVQAVGRYCHSPEHDRKARGERQS